MPEKSDTVARELRAHVNPEKAAFFPRFFKAGPGEYAEGDKFLGITVPNIRSVAKNHQDISLSVVTELLHSKWHEDRMCALFILVAKFKKADHLERQEIYDLYLRNTRYINNWDLVDLSSRDIVGAYIYDNPQLLSQLDDLASSDSLWERRIAIISTYFFLMKNDPEPTIRISKMLLNDKQDLIHKAVGWMLRELGKRVDQKILVDFLSDNYQQMPRTALRYAIEHFNPTTRARYLRGDFS